MSSRRPGGRPVLGSLALHAVLAVFVLAGVGHSELPPVRVYRVNIVSPPPQQAGEPAPAVAEVEPEPEPEPEQPPVEEPQPQPEPPKQPPPEPKKTPPKKEPEPTKEPEKKPEQPAPKPEPARPSTGANPDRKSPGGEDLNVNIEGEVFPYPGYLENIVLQVRRYFRWDGAPGLKAEVYFMIGRDGSVSDIRILRGSGNRQFDFAALGAVEVAGKRGAFGELPAGFQGDRLPVSFYIDAR